MMFLTDIPGHGDKKVIPKGVVKIYSDQKWLIELSCRRKPDLYTVSKSDIQDNGDCGDVTLIR